RQISGWPQAAKTMLCHCTAPCGLEYPKVAFTQETSTTVTSALHICCTIIELAHGPDIRL
ncbi:hypothetical protein TNCV_1334691, partial [Trichonephila clavipes]